MYPNALERLELVASYSETIERKLDVHYRNLGVFGGRFHADVQFLHDRDAAIRFFGLGPESRRDNETNMTLEVTGVYGIFGVNITRYARLSLGETLQRFEVRRGGVPNLPFTGHRFPDLPGIDGAVVHAQRVALIYDSRDSLTTPNRGLFTSLYAEASSRLLGSGADYVKTGAETIYHWPLVDRRLILVGRWRVEAIDGEADTPFMVRPELGGVDSLRGFSDNRFYGDASLVLSAEVRARVLRLRIFGIDAEFEVTPFVDVGKVFNTAGQFVGKAFEITPGVGFRGLAPPSVVGHIEVGFSREGPAIFVGLDYPF
jgi:outer membrane protein assembly factor BamA